METHPPIVIVTAMSGARRAIGFQNKLLWHIPDDLKRFKTLTLGHPIIMGRNTFESIMQILGKPLPGRTSIVLTRDASYEVPEGVLLASSLQEAITLAEKESPAEIHIGGGATLYRETLPLVSKLYVTWVDNEPEADTFFPEFLEDFTPTNSSGPRVHNELSYEWVDYERKRS